MITVIPKGIEDPGMELVALVDFVLGAQAALDIGLLEAIVSFFERRDAFVEILEVFLGIAGFGQYLLGKVLIKIIGGKIFADVPDKFQHVPRFLCTDEGV